MAGEFNVGVGDYNNAVAMINDVEVDAPKDRMATVDIDDILQHRLSVNSLDYEKAANVVLIAEGGGGFVTAGPAIKQPGQVISPRRTVVSHEAVDAAKEIKSIVGGAGREYERNVSKEAPKVKKGDLVLPTLSLQDQISELEKISMGVDEKVFNQEQMQIIVFELEGLGGRVRGERRESLDTFQKNLVAIRDRRLAEARTKANL